MDPQITRTRGGNSSARSINSESKSHNQAGEVGRAARIDQILKLLSDINWNRGTCWEGVCGSQCLNTILSNFDIPVGSVENHVKRNGRRVRNEVRL